MKSTDDLFLLISSMSKSEKGYFKKFASKHTIGEKNIYVKLFDEIEKMDEYDEAGLKNKFRGEKFAKNLYSTKNYLFNLILKALSSYHSEKYAVSRLNNMLIELNVLFEKGLYKQFKTLLNKAIEIAKKNDKLYYLALLYSRKLNALATDYYSGAEEEEYEKTKKATVDNLKMIRLREEFHFLYNDLFLLIKKMGSVRKKEDLEKLNKFVDNPLLKDEKFAGSFDTKFKFYSIWGHYYRVINDDANWYKYRRALLDLMESDRVYIKENPRSYVLALNNYLNACVYTGKYSSFKNNLEKLKGFAKQFENKKEYIDTQVRVFLLVSDLELNYFNRTGQFDKLKDKITEIEKGFARFSSTINENRKISLYNRIAYAYFILKDFNKSLEYVNRIMNLTDPKLEQEQHSFARIRNLIVHYELGNYDLLEYAVNSARRFLAKQERIYKFEKLILNFVVKAMKYPTERTRQGFYIKLKSDLNALSALEHFDIISWLESKIAKKDFTEILKTKTAA
jgi:hypothetical protein